MTLRENLRIIIFGTDTRAGKNFDIALIIAIIISVFVVLIDSVEHVRATYGSYLIIMEWILTIVFTIEYLLRIWVAKRPLRYMVSFYGLVDFVSISPSYLALFFEGAHILIAFRVLRLLRLFRVFKLIRYMEEAHVLITALRASKRKIIVFLIAMLSVVVIIGTVMYIVEGPANGFVNIPISMYWAVVTITTVGFGDITPQTALGRFFAGILMILGYSILAVPTGVFSLELSKAAQKVNNKTCPTCQTTENTANSNFCKDCGEKL